MDALLSVSRDEAEKLLLPLDSLFSEHERLALTEKQERLCRNGVDFDLEAPDGTYRFYAPNGEFLMLGAVQNGRSAAIKRFF